MKGMNQVSHTLNDLAKLLEVVRDTLSEVIEKLKQLALEQAE